MKFLIAIDGSAASEKGVQAFLGLVNPSRDKAVLLTAVELFKSYVSRVVLPTGESVSWQGKPSVEIEKALLDGAKSLLQKSEAQLKEAGLQCTTRVEVGEPREVICKIAKEEEADFLVLGSRGLGSMQRLMLGSVTEFVVHQAPCSVIVVR